MNIIASPHYSFRRFTLFKMGSLFKPVVTVLSSHSSPSLLHGLLHRLASTVMAAPPGPPFPPPPLQPQPPPPSPPPNPTVKQLVQSLVARVDQIKRRLGQVVQLAHTMNKKLNMVLHNNDVEYDLAEDDSDSDSDDSNSPSLSLSDYERD